MIPDRLSRQLLAGAGAASPADVVRHFGAVQAQDWSGALWAVGLRSAGALRDADVEAAIAAREIVRSWPMRSTLHFVPAEDLGWMLALLAPRALSGLRWRLAQLGLDEKELARARRILTRALRGGRALTRPAAYAALERAGVSTAGQRGINILGALAQGGVLCFGPRDGKQPTFVLLDEWIPRGRALSGDEALAELAARYFRGHGPATLADFAWWSGLTVAAAKRAIEAAAPWLAEEPSGEGKLWTAAGEREPASKGARTSRAHLLPPWDEWLVGYRDRSAAVGHVDGHDARRLELLGSPIVIVAGRARGKWRRELRPEGVRVTVELWDELPRRELAGARRAVKAAAERYAAFLDHSLELRLPPSR